MTPLKANWISALRARTGLPSRYLLCQPGPTLDIFAILVSLYLQQEKKPAPIWVATFEETTHLRCCFPRIVRSKGTPTDLPLEIKKALLSALSLTDYDWACLEALNDSGLPFTVIADRIEQGHLTPPEWEKGISDVRSEFDRCCPHLHPQCCSPSRRFS